MVNVGDVVVVKGSPFSGGLECDDEYIGGIGVVTEIRSRTWGIKVEQAAVPGWERDGTPVMVVFGYPETYLINLGPVG